MAINPTGKGPVPTDAATQAPAPAKAKASSTQPHKPAAGKKAPHPYSHKPNPDKALKGVTQERTTGSIGNVSTATPDYQGTLSINGTSFPAFKRDKNEAAMPGCALVHIPGGSSTHNIYVSQADGPLVNGLLKNFKGDISLISYTRNPNDR